MSRKRLKPEKRRIAESIFLLGLDLILPGDRVVVKDADNLTLDVRSNLGAFGNGIEGTVVQFYERMNAEKTKSRLYCYVKTRDGQSDFEVPYENLQIIKRPEWNQTYAGKLKRSWEHRNDVINKLKEIYRK
jgi:hypothetical protein